MGATVHRSGEDAEPSGSAGRPIALQIEGHGLTDTALVVTRWFGGTKLGVGGLMRAYGGAAGQALDHATIRTVLITKRIQLCFPYSCSSVVDSLLAAHSLSPEQSDYGIVVKLWMRIPEDQFPVFASQLQERSAARVQLIELEKD